MRDKIACAQFVSALSDGFLRRTLQLEGVTSLKIAVERAKVVEIIQGKSFERKFGGNENSRRNFERMERKDARNDEESGKGPAGNEKGGSSRKGNWRGSKSAAGPKEC